ncbi:MAG TPA: alternative ribosome rescue aminoacyl-tRNA hydrolase ArfB [Gelidibacter sp.]|uniref:alternative ribosome rescue aminoacyl-tRNA hydrolase ArfB n=1 Tax=Gelidibacter sp. TaxID=2018083 RepID=UPI002BB50164|nr:alternative ribosome rescue aminoacyl-tRNA hydrolase ArfB [Gelidibacter sp.]HXJ99461.1 alternative ribosome rescue aminoacyl-tRNA hydrolase ArfB [Gelidibacter sp.]
MNKDILQSELQFRAVRSSGAGGQNVNKVASKVELIFDLDASLGLTDDEKQRLKQSIANRLTKDNMLLLQCDESRSQHKNKTLVIERFFNLLNDGLIVQKERVQTKIPRSVIKKRLKAKRKVSDKKANRRPPEIE